MGGHAQLDEQNKRMLKWVNALPAMQMEAEDVWWQQQEESSGITLSAFECSSSKYSLPSTFTNPHQAEACVWRPGVWHGGYATTDNASVINNSNNNTHVYWYHDHHPIHPWLRNYLLTRVLQDNHLHMQDRITFLMNQFETASKFDQQSNSGIVIDLDLDCSSDEDD
jgi:hypothetical protein